LHPSLPHASPKKAVLHEHKSKKKKAKSAPSITQTTKSTQSLHPSLLIVYLVCLVILFTSSSYLFSLQIEWTFWPFTGGETKIPNETPQKSALFPLFCWSCAQSCSLYNHS
jgi:hypothetical protein